MFSSRQTKEQSRKRQPYKKENEKQSADGTDGQMDRRHGTHSEAMLWETMNKTREDILTLRRAVHGTENVAKNTVETYDKKTYDKKSRPSNSHKIAKKNMLFGGFWVFFGNLDMREAS